MPLEKTHLAKKLDNITFEDIKRIEEKFRRVNNGGKK